MAVQKISGYFETNRYKVKLTGRKQITLARILGYAWIKAVEIRQKESEVLKLPMNILDSIH